MSEVMVETLEGLGILPMRAFEDTPIGRRLPLVRRPVVASDDHTPPRPLGLPLFGRRGNGGIVPPNRGNGGIVPPWMRGRVSDMTPPVLLPIPAPGNTGIVPPKASAIVTTGDAPVYSKPLDESVWTPPDDALVQDQWGMDQGVDATLQDDLYASQDYQADGEGDSNDGSLWGLGDALDLIPYVLPDQPVAAAPASSGGFLNNLSSFFQSALPAAAQVYASVQATKQGNPALGAQVAQQTNRPGVPMSYPGGVVPPGFTGPAAYGAPSWFSQRTILPSMSNGAVVGIGAAVAVGLLVILKKRRGA